VSVATLALLAGLSKISFSHILVTLKMLKKCVENKRKPPDSIYLPSGYFRPFIDLLFIVFP